VWSIVVVILKGKADEHVEKPGPVPLYTTQIPHGFACNLIWVSNCRHRRITIWPSDWLPFKDWR